jgi:hypothetical protein
MKQDVLDGTQTPRPYGRIALTLALWLVSVVLTFFVVFAARDILVWVMATLLVREGTTTGQRIDAAQIINLASMCIIIVLGLLGIGVLVVSGDSTFKRLGEPRQIRRLLALVVVEAAIVLPSAWYFWM